MGHFDPASALELIEAEQVTAMFPAFPPLTQGVLNSPGYSPAALASRPKGGSRWRARHWRADLPPFLRVDRNSQVST
jgi:hypothetical protein